MLFCMTCLEAQDPYKALNLKICYSWVVETYFADSDLASLLQVGNYSSSNLSSEAIDTNAEISKPPRLPDKSNRER
jgi:hypothetical protein